MITVSEKSGMIAAINVFTVKPEQQQRLVDFLVENKEIAHEASRLLINQHSQELRQHAGLQLHSVEQPGSAQSG